MPEHELSCPDPYYEGPRSSMLRTAMAHLGLTLKMSTDGEAWIRSDKKTVYVPPGLLFPRLHWIVAQGCERLNFGLTDEPPPAGVVVPLTRRDDA